MSQPAKCGTFHPQTECHTTLTNTCNLKASIIHIHANKNNHHWQNSQLLVTWIRSNNYTMTMEMLNPYLTTVGKGLSTHSVQSNNWPRLITIGCFYLHHGASDTRKHVGGFAFETFQKATFFICNKRQQENKSMQLMDKSLQMGNILSSMSMHMINWHP